MDSIILTPNAGEKDHKKHRELQTYLTPEHRFRNPINLKINYRNILKRYCILNQVMFMPKTITICHYINRIKPKIMRSTQDIWKGLKLFKSFMIKTLCKLIKEGNIPNFYKRLYQKKLIATTLNKY